MTCNNSTIISNSNKIKKIYNNSYHGRRAFLRELFFYFRIYKLNLNYVPKLIKFNHKELWIELSNVGISLDKLYYRKNKKHLNHHILELHKKLKKDTLFQTLGYNN